MNENGEVTARVKRKIDRYDPETAHPERPIDTIVPYRPLVGDNLYEYGERASAQAHAALVARYGHDLVEHHGPNGTFWAWCHIEPVLRLAAKFDRRGGD